MCKCFWLPTYDSIVYRERRISHIFGVRGRGRGAKSEKQYLAQVEDFGDVTIQYLGTFSTVIVHFLEE